MQERFADEIVEVIDGVEYPRSSSWIKELEAEDHWRLYWRQQHLMNSLICPGNQLLEIGPGTGFTTDYLRSKGFEVTTLDFDSGKSPDIVANIVEYSFADKYDAILAFEVFEHIPFDKFQEVLPRVASACRQYCFFSIPQNRKTPFYFELKLPKLKPFRWDWSVKRGRPMSAYHFWEIGFNGVSLDDVEMLVASSGLEILHRDEMFERLFFACRRK